MDGNPEVQLVQLHGNGQVEGSCDHPSPLKVNLQLAQDGLIVVVLVVVVVVPAGVVEVVVGPIVVVAGQTVVALQVLVSVVPQQGRVMICPALANRQAGLPTPWAQLLNPLSTFGSWQAHPPPREKHPSLIFIHRQEAQGLRESPGVSHSHLQDPVGQGPMVVDVVDVVVDVVDVLVVVAGLQGVDASSLDDWELYHGSKHPQVRLGLQVSSW